MEKTILHYLKFYSLICGLFLIQLQQLNATNIKHHENLEETVWKILRKYFLLESGDSQQINLTR